MYNTFTIQLPQNMPMTHAVDTIALRKAYVCVFLIIIVVGVVTSVMRCATRRCIKPYFAHGVYNFTITAFARECARV